MRFVPVKSEEKQGAAAVFRVRDLLIRQRTQTINALRGHLTEFGEVVPHGAASMRRLFALIEEPESDLPETARATLQVLVDGLRHLDERIAELDAEIGPLTALAVEAFAPDMAQFKSGRDFAA